jgi:hypothetical protein
VVKSGAEWRVMRRHSSGVDAMRVRAAEMQTMARVVLEAKRKRKCRRRRSRKVMTVRSNVRGGGVVASSRLMGKKLDLLLQKT